MDMGDTCESGSNVESFGVQDGLERKTDQREASRPRKNERWPQETVVLMRLKNRFSGSELWSENGDS